MHDAVITILAWLGAAAFGVTALINGIIAAVALLGGHMISVVGDAIQNAQVGDAAQQAAAAADAASSATTAKLYAAAFGALAAVELVAAILLKSGLRTVFIPIVAMVSMGVWIAMMVNANRFGALDATVLGCMLLAIAGWWKLPRATRVRADVADVRA